MILEANESPSSHVPGVTSFIAIYKRKIILLLVDNSCEMKHSDYIKCEHIM